MRGKQLLVCPVTLSHPNARDGPAGNLLPGWTVRDLAMIFNIFSSL